MTAITRRERFIRAAIDGTPDKSAPLTRLEIYLAKIAGADVVLPEPITRIELFLAKIAGADVIIPEPITRAERYLAAIAGEDVVIPVPVTRVETLLTEWAGTGLPKGYKRIAGIVMDAATYYKITDFFLRGSDTVRVSIAASSNCNVFGCYTTTAADDNYSLYVSTANNAKYMRYDGGTFKSQWRTQDLGERFDLVITPTGTSGFPGAQDDTWTEASFTASADMCIGSTSPTATSSKFKGTIFGAFVVDGRFEGIPCKREADGLIGYYDKRTQQFFEPIGTNPTEYVD